MLSAVIVLVIMVVPIVSSVSRELFTRVPRDMQDGSLALGATRWETIRKVTIPYVGPGLLAASVLGLGRAIGEAIAVTQVIGVTTHGLSLNFFNTGDTLASRIAGQFQGAASNLQIASLFYLALILLVLSLIFNLIALVIIRASSGNANERRRRIARAFNPPPRRRPADAPPAVRQRLMVGLCRLAALLAVAMLGAHRLHRSSCRDSRRSASTSSRSRHRSSRSVRARALVLPMRSSAR